MRYTIYFNFINKAVYILYNCSQSVKESIQKMQSNSVLSTDRYMINMSNVTFVSFAEEKEKQ